MQYRNESGWLHACAGKLFHVVTDCYGDNHPHWGFVESRLNLAARDADSRLEADNGTAKDETLSSVIFWAKSILRSVKARPIDDASSFTIFSLAEELRRLAMWLEQDQNDDVELATMRMIQLESPAFVALESLNN